MVFCPSSKKLTKISCKYKQFLIDSLIVYSKNIWMFVQHYHHKKFSTGYFNLKCIIDLEQYIYYSSMHPFANRPSINPFAQNFSRAIPHIPIKQTHPSPFRQPDANNYGLVPGMGYHSQRVSGVSSQKISVVTRATKGDFIPKASMIPAQSPKSERFFLNDNPYKIEKPTVSPRKMVEKETSNLIASSSKVRFEEKISMEKQLSFPVIRGVANISQSRHINEMRKQYCSVKQTINVVQEPVQQVMIAPSNSSINHIRQKIYKITQKPHQSPLVHVQQTAPVCKKLQSKTPKRTITQSAQAPLVGDVTVQNFQLPPRIRDPPRRLNRLYRSAVYDRRGFSTRPVSRARSTASFIPKPKKRDVLIRRQHRSFISDKKIPVIGSYLSNDKSKNCVIRQFTPHLPKICQSKVIGMQQIEVIPTQIIKIPIGKMEDLRSESYESSLINDDFCSFTQNPILDQPTLIKKYIPSNMSESKSERRNSQGSEDSFSSSRSKRLSDNIKISVYKSPSVIIHKAETIVTGPKLTKNHVKRIAVEGKVISKYERNEKNSSSSQRSSSHCGARYEKMDSSRFNNLIPVSNPYVKTNIADIVQRLRIQSEEKIQTCNFSEIPYQQQQSIGKDDSHHETMISDFNLISSQHTVSKTQTHILASSSSRQGIKHKRQLSTQFSLQSSIKKQIGFTDYLNTSNQRKQEVNKILFESPIQTERKSSTDLVTDFTSSKKVVEQVSLDSYQCRLNLQNLNKHKYKIPKLSSDLEEDLKKLRLENQRKKKELEENWKNSAGLFQY